MNPIPDTNHVSRYCSKKFITAEGRVTGAAFQLRSRDRGLLSVNWNEKLNLASRDQEMEALSAIYAVKMPKEPVAENSISILNVGNTKHYVQSNSEDNRLLEFLDNPSAIDPSHASIKNVMIDDMIVPDLIAESVIERYVIN